jgi:hypothetical protein
MARRVTTGRGTVIRGVAAMTQADVRFFRAAGLGFLPVGLLGLAVAPRGAAARAR